MKNYLKSISLLGDAAKKEDLKMPRNLCFIIFFHLIFCLGFFAEAGIPSVPTNLQITTELSVSGSIFRGDDATKATRAVIIEAYETSSSTPIASFTTQTGFYTLTVPAGFTGTIKPTATDITFSPASIEFPLAASEPYSNINFAALYSFYVSKKTGNDSNEGASSSPFSSIQAAADVVFPGDSVYIRAGTYIASGGSCGAPGCENWYGTSVLNVTRDGTLARPISFEAFGTDLVTLEGRGINEVGVKIESNHIVVSKLIATNFLGPGFQIYANWRTIGAPQPVLGPPVFSGTPTGRQVTGVTISEVIAHHNSNSPTGAQAGIQVLGQVSDCVIESSASYQNGTGIRFREFDAILYTRDYALLSNRAPWPDAPRSCTVRNSITFDNKKIDENSDGIGGRYPTNMTFANNISFNNDDDNFDSTGPVNSKWIGNVAFNANPDRTVDGDGNGLKLCTRKGGGNIVRNNISFLNPRAGFDDDDGTDNIFQNNTAYKNFWGMISESDIGPAQELQNNLSYLNTSIDGMLSRDCLNAPPFAPALTNYNYWGNGLPPVNPCNKQIPYNDSNSLSNTVTSNGLTAVGPPLFVDPIDSISQIDLSALATLTPGKIGTVVGNIIQQVRAAFALKSLSPLINAGRDVGQPFAGPKPDIGAVESL